MGYDLFILNIKTIIPCSAITKVITVQIFTEIIKERKHFTLKKQLPSSYLHPFLQLLVKALIILPIIAAIKEKILRFETLLILV